MTTELTPDLFGELMSRLPAALAAETCDNEVIAAADSVQPIADELDRVRRIVADLGLATLMAEISETPTSVVCGALQEVAEAASRAVAELRHWGRYGH